MKTIYSHKTSLIRVLLLGSVLGLNACAQQQGPSHGLAAEKQPEVQMVRMAHDVTFEEDGSLSRVERERLANFLNRHAAGYGDQFQIDDPNNEPERFNTLRRALATHGHELAVSPIAYGSTPKDGNVRIILTRYSVTPPACPDWSTPSTNNWANGQSSNFGCATKTNLSLQVADPRDLIEGKTHSGPEPTSTTKAVNTYRNRALSGANGQLSGGGTSGSGNN